ncbi:MAG TPA: hypothetical protein VKI99_19300 [Candidatus Dormibacteraeota bacterium]|nr:hypothetical protein [Candidatus Dormibacteraeota bacterium]
METASTEESTSGIAWGSAAESIGLGAESREQATHDVGRFKA